MTQRLGITAKLSSSLRLAISTMAHWHDLLPLRPLPKSHAANLGIDGDMAFDTSDLLPTS